MRIIQVHNFYQQAGGEDAVVAAERAMLEKYGHTVCLFQRSNEEIGQWPSLQKFFRVIWNRKVCKELEVLIDEFKPDVVHFHNVFHAISMSAYQAARRKKVPVVQTLHNYRLFCLNGLFFREGHVCERCLSHRMFPWSGVRYRCYRDSLAGSLVVATMLFVHRLLRMWINPVSRFIVLTSFCRDKFIECGIPAEKITVKPNFLSQDPGAGEDHRAAQFLFMGRLSEEKGIRILMKGWQRVADRRGTEESQMLIAGAGPLLDELSRSKVCGLALYGYLSRSESMRLLKKVRGLVFPSGCYETFGLSIVEAMACGTPVLVSDGGAPASLIQDGQTGLHFRAGDPEDLAEKMEWMMTHPDECAVMGRKARQEYEQRYTSEVNYGQLMVIYQQAVAGRSNAGFRR